MWLRYRTRYGVTGGDPTAEALLGHIVEGYARVALEAIEAIARDRGDPLVLNVPAEGALEGVEAEDVVEVPCLVGWEGPRPIAVGAPPAPVRGLLLRVKEYERLTVEAGLTGSRKKAVEALAAHPLVDSPARAEALFADFSRAQGPHLAYLR